jgi:hypothetical protein
MWVLGRRPGMGLRMRLNSYRVLRYPFCRGVVKDYLTGGSHIVFPELWGIKSGKARGIYPLIPNCGESWSNCGELFLLPGSVYNVSCFLQCVGN